MKFSKCLYHVAQLEDHMIFESISWSTIGHERTTQQNLNGSQLCTLHQRSDSEEYRDQERKSIFNMEAKLPWTLIWTMWITTWDMRELLHPGKFNQFVQQTWYLIKIVLPSQKWWMNLSLWQEQPNTETKDISKKL